MSQATVRRRHEELVDAIDIMPCDYRYFCGKENPLDKLVEAATMMEQLEERSANHNTERALRCLSRIANADDMISWSPAMAPNLE